jgi:hypothetical protein
VKEWEATLPPPIEGESAGHRMTQKYYTENLLPKYINMVQFSRLHDTLNDTVWVLQEDGDPPHGTKTKDNVASNLRDYSWIHAILYTAQSPDLNPIEGVWLILKQRAKKGIADSEHTLDAWDGTKKSLQRILTEVWDEITLKKIREIIKEMPSRCAELTCNSGQKLRSDKW